MHLRSIKSSIKESVDSFEAALNSGRGHDWVVSWDGTEDLACLDVDWHTGGGPPKNVSSFVSLVSPSPRYWWVSRGGGLHLIYESGDLSAGEYAAIAALWFLENDAICSCEILSKTRLPGAGHKEHTQTYEQGAILRYLKKEVGHEELQKWLTDHDLRFGSHEHTKCPFDPCVNSRGGKPVRVDERGVYCFRCHSVKGIPLREWGDILSAGNPSLIRTLASGFVVWSNAEPVLMKEIGDRIARRALKQLYKASLKIFHGIDHPLISSAFAPFDWLRGEGGIWLNRDTLKVSAVNKERALLGRLPSARSAYIVKDAKGEDQWKVVLDENALQKHIQLGAKIPGFPEYRVTKGARLWGHYLDYDEGFAYVERHRPLRPVVAYRPPDRRMPIAEAYRKLIDYFPGINLKYLELLLVARGFAESGKGPVPMILVEGPSGSAKSSTVLVASEILGDELYVLKDETDGKITQALGEIAANSFGFVVLDEFCKGLPSAAQVDKFTPFLTMGREYSFRKLYVGQTTIHWRSAVIVTNTDFADAVHQDRQIGRRFIKVRLYNEVPQRWEKTAGDIREWRKSDTNDIAEAIVGHIVDSHFTTPGVTFPEIAVSLGFDELRADSGEGVSRDTLVNEFFVEVCKSEPAPTRWKGRGWKMIDRNKETPLKELWELLCDDLMDAYFSSRIISERDLQSVIGAWCPVKLELSRNGSKFGVRFCRADVSSRSNEFRVNAELVEDGDDPTTTAGPEKPPEEVVTSLDQYDFSALMGEKVDTEGDTGMATNSPENFWFMDLETRSFCDLGKRGGRAYASDMTTGVLCATFVSKDLSIAYVWSPLVDEIDLEAVRVPILGGDKLDIRWGLPQGGTWVANNAEEFDRLVWEALYPSKAPDGWVDTLPLFRAVGLPGKLDEVGKALFGIGKDEAGKKAMLRLSIPVKGNFLPVSSRNLIPTTRYCLQDTLMMAAAWHKEKLDETLTSHRLDIECDSRVNSRGIKLNVDLAETILETEAKLKEAKIDSLAEDLGLDHKSTLTYVRSHKKVLDLLHEHGFEVDSVRAEVVDSILSDSDTDVPAKVRKVLQTRRDIASVTAGKLKSALRRVSPDGRLRDTLVYHGAHTGRWSGKGFQVHNLPSGVIDVDRAVTAILDGELDTLSSLVSSNSVEEVLKYLLRPTIEAPEGKVLGIVDYSQIEARMLGYLAGEDPEVFRKYDAGEGPDPYCKMASMIFGRDITTKGPERQIGKALELGCGYQLGYGGFAVYAQGYNVDFEALNLTPAKAVDAYRDAHLKIAGYRAGVFKEIVVRKGGLWQLLVAGVKRVVGDGHRETIGKCDWYMRDGHLRCTLPSGRELVYREAKIQMVVPGFGGDPRPTITYLHPKHGRVPTYGGKLAENITQAACRDILAGHLRAVEAAGFNPVLHVHDEIICELDDPDHIQEMAAIMRENPAWLAGFPLAVDGMAVRSYRKEGGDILAKT